MRLRALLRRWFNRRTIEQDMREEMMFHLEARIETLKAQGVPPAEARRAARLEFGNAEVHREECRAALGYRLWDELRSDVRFAIRSLSKNPGYSATAVVILALAIGANSAFFSVFSHHVLKPLAVQGADRHFDLEGVNERFQSTGGWTGAEADVFRRAGSRQIEGLYEHRTMQLLVLEPVQRLGIASFVSANYFSLLGGRAAIGRTFSEPERQEPVAVLSSSGQHRYFPDDPAPLGKKIRVRTTVLTVIGVMPPSFTGTVPTVPDFWVGAGLQNALIANTVGEPRSSLAGLLAPRVSPAQAEAVLTAVATRLPRSIERRISRIELEPRSGLLAANVETNTAAAVVFALFLMVIAIACANLANLCLARAAARTHEVGTRLSLGASRSRIVRQLLTESSLVAVFGAVAGVVTGILVLDQVQQRIAVLAADLGLTVAAVSPDWRVLFFSAILGLLSGLAFGVLPALEITSASLTLSTKREHSYFAGRVRPRRMRGILIGSQVAGSLVLLVLAGILIRHIGALNDIAPGYDADRIYDLRVDTPQPALLAALEQQPVIASVSAVERVPLYGEPNQESGHVDGRSERLSVNRVDHRFFTTLGLRIDGRGFTAQEAATNARVIVISQATAQRLWPGRSPLQKEIRFDRDRYEVVGVVPDVISGWLFRGPDATAVYLPASAGHERLQSVLVRITSSPAATLPAIRLLCARTPGGTGCEPVSLRDISGMQRFPFAAAASVAGVLGAMALLLTVVGLYSITSYLVVQRRREIGVHLALGASPARVMRRLLREASRSVIAGVAVGLPVCLILSRAMNASVLRLPGFDAATYLGIPALLAAITTVACAVPARRAAGADPMTSLRED